MADSFATRARLDVNGTSYAYASLAKLGEQFDIARLPYSLKILLENLLPQKAGDVIAIREKSRKQARIAEALELAKQIGFPAWVEVAADKCEGTFKKTPDRDEFASDINESLIVELYSR